MHLARLTLHRLRLPLKTPYKLAFGPVHAFDTILAVAEDSEGAQGIGEATILTGYTPESIEQSWGIANRLAYEVLDQDPKSAKSLLLNHHGTAPFTVTALVTAIEMLEGSPWLRTKPGTRVPLLAGLNATEASLIEDEFERHLAAGFQTIKVKVGFDWAADAKRLGFIQTLNRGRARLRVDGNQGFTVADAIQFLRAIDPDDIELLEQPCAMEDWEAAATIAEIAHVPLMLDESIYGAEEIKRAADMNACQFIKLKLMKAGSLERLAEQLTLIRTLGMTPVLGNGVASDIGCWMEAAVASHLVETAGEMNGFLRPRASVLETPLSIADGALAMPSEAPRLNHQTLDQVTEAST